MTVRSAALIVVVDDDAPVRAAICSLLASAGFDTAAFASAEQCLLDARLDGAALAIIDIGLPGMNGLALQARLSERALPVIIVSGQADTVSAAAAVRAGAVALLHKPFDGERLLELVAQTLR